VNRIFRLGLVLAALALWATACGTARPRVITLAGSSEGYTDGSGSTAQFSGPLDVAVDAQGNVYVADSANHRIRKIAPDGAASLMVVTLAGSDEVFPVDGPLSEAVFSTPTGLAFAASGALYVADSAMKDPHPMRVRVIAPEEIVTTLAGSGQAGYVDGVGLDAQFKSPASLAVDQAGNVYVADTTNNRIRKIAPDGTVTTLAGSTETGYAAGYADGPASQALFQGPRSVDVDGAGNVYVADTGNHCIRAISPGGQVTTLAGTPEPGYADGQGAVARFNFPSGIAADAQGNLYVADTANHRIRKITPDGAVTTLAGSGTPGNADGPATEARFRGPEGVAVDSAGNVYVADTGNHRIRKIVVRGGQ
jgi:sugar lactone lactonase YvrE